MAVQLAAQLGKYLGDRRGRAGGGGNQAHARGAGAAQILVWLIKNTLRVGQVMDGGDRTVADAQLLMDHLDHRCQAVGGAGRRGDDAVLRRIVQAVIDAHDDVQRARLLHRRADHHALDPLLQILLQHRNGLHLAARLYDKIAARPIGVCDRLVGADLHPLAIDDQAVAVGARLVLPAAMHRVEIEQVRMGGRIAGRIVDLHEIQLRPIPGRTQGQATDAAETVDAYFYAHG